MASSKRSPRRKRNPMGGTFIVTHAPAPITNPAKRQVAGRLFDYRTGAGVGPATAKQVAESKRASKRDGGPGVIVVKGQSVWAEASPRSKKNPAYRASFTSPADASTVRKAIKAVGADKLRLRSSDKATKRKPGPYALFMKAQGPALRARGLSAPEVMKEVGRLWRAKGAKQNPSKDHGMLYEYGGMFPLRKATAHDAAEYKRATAGGARGSITRRLEGRNMQVRVVSSKRNPVEPLEPGRFATLTQMQANPRKRNPFGIPGTGISFSHAARAAAADPNTGAGWVTKMNPKKRKRNPPAGAHGYCVVKFASLSDTTGKTLSHHATLKEAQVAMSKRVMKNGKLIPSYQSFGIVG